jgi:hypothetical protein
MKRSRPHALALFLAAINVILLMKPAALQRLSFNGTIDETIPLSSAWDATCGSPAAHST